MGAAGSGGRRASTLRCPRLAGGLASRQSSRSCHHRLALHGCARRRCSGAHRRRDRHWQCGATQPMLLGSCCASSWPCNAPGAATSVWPRATVRAEGALQPGGCVCQWFWAKWDFGRAKTICRLSRVNRPRARSALLLQLMRSLAAWSTNGYKSAYSPCRTFFNRNPGQWGFPVRTFDG